MQPEFVLVSTYSGCKIGTGTANGSRDVTIYKELNNPSQYHPAFAEGFKFFIREEFADALSHFLIAFKSGEQQNKNKYLSYAPYITWMIKNWDWRNV